MKYEEARKSLNPIQRCIVKMEEGEYEICTSSHPPKGFHSWSFTLGEWNRSANIVKLTDDIEKTWEKDQNKTIAYYETYDGATSRYIVETVDDEEILSFLLGFNGCWMNLSTKDNHTTDGQAWIREKHKQGLLYIGLPTSFLEEVKSDHEIY